MPEEGKKKTLTIHNKTNERIYYRISFSDKSIILLPRSDDDLDVGHIPPDGQMEIFFKTTMDTVVTGLPKKNKRVLEN
jgi:hypothetical protein